MIDFKEKLSEVLENSRERFTNPLFYSFVISWCAFNWRVPIGLIWYNSNEIKDIGHKTIFDFIGSNISEPFWAPFGIAVLYTLASPLFRNVLSVLTAFFNGLGNKISFKAAERAPISLSKYHELQTQYKQLEDQVATNIQEDAKRNENFRSAQSNAEVAQKQVAELQAERNNHLATINAAQEAIEKEQKKFGEFRSLMSDPTPLFAYYILTARNDSGDIVQSIRVHFSGATFSILDKKYQVRTYFFHPEKYQVLMSLYNAESKTSIYFDVAKHQDTNKGLVLVGFLNKKPISLTLDEENNPQNPLLIDRKILPTPIVLKYKNGTERTFMIKIVDGNMIFSEPTAEASLIEMNAMVIGTEEIELKLLIAIQYVLSKMHLPPSDSEALKANIFNAIMKQTARELVINEIPDERSKLTVRSR